MKNSISIVQWIVDCRYSGATPVVDIISSISEVKWRGHTSSRVYYWMNMLAGSNHNQRRICRCGYSCNIEWAGRVVTARVSWNVETSHVSHSVRIMSPSLWQNYHLSRFLGNNRVLCNPVYKPKVTARSFIRTHLDWFGHTRGYCINTDSLTWRRL
jgi:hypothetical protein